MTMLSLGIYFCAKVYQNWDDQPVLTTIKNAGLPVEMVNTKGPYTLDIFTHNRYCDKKIILSHECLKVKVSS
jgi:hypothetical protein